VITYILLSGSMPFDPSTYSAEALEHCNALEFPAALFGEISDEARQFISSLLQVDPSKRLSAETALLHPWLRTLEPPIADGLSTVCLSTPTLRLTPLPTPRRLKQLQDSGKLKKAWDRAAEVGPLGSAKHKPGSEGEAAREAAKRSAEALAEAADVPLLTLPAEVTKRLRSSESMQSNSSGSEREVEGREHNGDVGEASVGGGRPSVGRPSPSKSMLAKSPLK